MKTHENQARQILCLTGVAGPRGSLATSPLEAQDAARQLGADSVVVKAAARTAHPRSSARGA